MLGDGCLTKVVRKQNSGFAEMHSESQLGWLTWKKDKLMPLSRKIHLKTTIGRKNIYGKVMADPTKSYNSCSLNTCKHPFLTELERKWYKRDENGNYIFKKVGNRLHRII